MQYLWATVNPGFQIPDDLQRRKTAKLKNPAEEKEDDNSFGPSPTGLSPTSEKLKQLHILQAQQPLSTQRTAQHLRRIKNSCGQRTCPTKKEETIFKRTPTSLQERESHHPPDSPGLCPEKPTTQRGSPGDSNNVSTLGLPSCTPTTTPAEGI
ncbi:hypothetical protein NDU88_001470 [Pleurodeles waltl]|uniref:Uncharacterized protein n=1 Tax=Pleurodeles waltl TaxID=8319 RepID=A0AAV7P3Z8_PLEWA|nr:hypothetical protein NDU88_001470 [Pleurodeles waltl]